MHWSASVYLSGVTPPRERCTGVAVFSVTPPGERCTVKAGIEPRSAALEADVLLHGQRGGPPQVTEGDTEVNGPHTLKNHRPDNEDDQRAAADTDWKIPGLTMKTFRAADRQTGKSQD